ncbi:histone-lysine N-methyltransferase ATXR3 [Impatiens glandulifera]|uniref:histone-lysine N-methyltransferase ATXR3 n=1 Tax=Impatiens glandulifera TaxID=253017 RepID=UPI001FB111AA|nr:histone-lysine N-methyltransferase ATXR3 [Impatiens glandulifera]XP_047313545.1 histone-lysine N-methyltransferase ATXR3 [Impatiens glandulifera]XP_047313547.1 histone-lysine N-methyltransferase ATXR3 [Impatiens glandulifera]
MGDGGVACVSLQPIMERLSGSENLCGGNNGKFSSTEVSSVSQGKMKAMKDHFPKKEETLDNVNSSSEVENGELVIKDEIEEGELGSGWPNRDIENGEFVPERSHKHEIKSEIEKVELPPSDKCRNEELEKGEFVHGKGRKDYSDRREYYPGRSRANDYPEKGKQGEFEKRDFGYWRNSKFETEKREFVPERWHRNEVIKDEYKYQKCRGDLDKDRGWKYDREGTPSFGKCSGDKDFRSGSQYSNRAARWETGHDNNPKLGLKIVNGEVPLKNNPSNGNNQGQESGNRSKRHVDSPEITDRRNYGEYTNQSSLKSRKLYLEDNHSFSRSVERSGRYITSSRNISSDRYSLRNYESSVVRTVHDRYGSSPRTRAYNTRGRSSSRHDRSPYDRGHHYDNRNRSPNYYERSPQDRDRKHDRRRNQSPSYSERSPSERGHYDDHQRNKSPGYSEKSLQDRGRYHDHRDLASSSLECSPIDKIRPNGHKETSKKNGANEKLPGPSASKEQEDMIDHDSSGKNLQASKECQERISLHNGDDTIEKMGALESHKEERLESQVANVIDNTTWVNGTEELPSMEEDMDICDTPPHLPVLTDLTPGKWFYLDYSGLECGPSKLYDLKTLVEQGFLVSDHLIKHSDSDRWVTVENALSPLVTMNFPNIESDAVTQLVSPPEASGNMMANERDTAHHRILQSEVILTTLEETSCCIDDNSAIYKPSKEFHIEERVGALLEGFSVTSGKELEAIGEALQMTFEHADSRMWVDTEDCASYNSGKQDDIGKDKVFWHPELANRESAEKANFVSVVDGSIAFGDIDGVFAGPWSCKGGDWMRNEEAVQDISIKKFVLNDGFPLCQMPRSGFTDPRWHHKDDLYYPSQCRRIDLPTWAFSVPDECNDPLGGSWEGQSKPIATRCMKGTMLPVVRINGCVIKDHGSFVSESHSKARLKDKYSSRSSRHYSISSEGKRSSEETVSFSKYTHQEESLASCKSIMSGNIVKDRLCTIEDLQIHLGEWYYLDGTGHERGPSSFSEMQKLAEKNIIPKYASVLRKTDRLWVPVTSATEVFETAQKVPELTNHTVSEPGASSPFNNLHPQFIGFTRGKLHELVMKSYKSREFMAAINEVLDPWINAKQPKDTEKFVCNIGDDYRPGKRARFLLDGTEEYEVGATIGDIMFDDLCCDNKFQGENTGTGVDPMSWGLMDGQVLARIFHFLKADMKSLVHASLTCKHWRILVKYYKHICKQVDLSSLGPNCTDTMFWEIMSGYKKEKVDSLILLGCINVSSSLLEEIIRSFPCLSSIDIRECSQLGDLPNKYTKINWIMSRKQIIDRASSAYTSHNGLTRHGDHSSGLKDYLESSEKRDSANQLFHGSLYKRSKLFDARKSSSILPRDAHMRRWTVKKSENGYKKMEQFLALGLKDIMKENTIDFFVPKVTEIEARIKKGYYAGRGLSAVKEDIIRMCRDAIKARCRSEAVGMNHMLKLFIQLATRLENSSRPHERDDSIKNWKDDSTAHFSSTTSRYKKLNQAGERKHMIRHNRSSSINGSSDNGDSVSDQEIRRRLSRLNRKFMDSGSETSDGLDESSEEAKTDTESAASGAESDLEFPSGSGTRDSRGDVTLSIDDAADSWTEDREWGARMTKASLVPPVTRKYEVIDQYVIVADEDEVQRKMRVSLPEDYADKLNAQKNGLEESDMEIPEVKNYKPRKFLGTEVIEQEVYGIDPYTHNLVLDSMPGESDWTLTDKHLFIEDVLLRTLNKKVEHYTGTGNTPMKYSLQPVVVDILKNAEENDDMQTVKLCESILKQIDCRAGDKYVAYRKGLGVVCNKEGGFSEDDFVVEFLGEVYPAWKWFEKQDGIRSLQKNSKEPATEFYNIYLERPKGDADGYDLVVVDAMHKANYASRICHSCHPNCEAKVTAVNGHYQIGIYTVRPIEYGEEITFDYNSVTESKEEYEASVCLCGSRVCRGSYLNLTGDGAFQKVLNEWNGILDCHYLMLEACELNIVTEEDYLDLGRAGLGSCLLGGLPDWLVAYAARLVRFINFERTKLPEAILRHNLEEKRKYFIEISIEVERNDAEIQAEGVYNQRLQNLALTLDKVRYVMRRVYGDPKKAPPLLEKLSPEEAVSFLWKGDGSFVEDLLESITPYMDDVMLNDLKAKIHVHNPSGSTDVQKELKKSLIWLRDEVRNLPCTYKCRHDAAADLIHIYAHTKSFFRVREYKTVTSEPVYISPLDLGPNCSDKLGPGLHEYCKSYGENYCLGQLIFWHTQANADPDSNLAKASRGCLSLPDIGSFYAKPRKPSRQRVYGRRTVKSMLARMEKQPQRAWPEDQIWQFKNNNNRERVFGSPMLDSVVLNSPLDKEMLHWLKSRPAIFQATWDR